MRIESSSYETYLQALEEWKAKMAKQNTETTTTTTEESQTDSYIPSYSALDIPMPTSTYNANGQMTGDMPPMPPAPPVEATEETSSSSTTSTGTDALLSELSETFRANTDSILSTLDSLGLTLEDLSDKENLEKLAEAMNEGAAALGVPVPEDSDSLIDELYEKLTENWSSYFEEES
uniref:hypothetical protein n=1 Tax=Roseburia sp. TaxID=2049040 RepID=UPI003FF109ED